MTIINLLTYINDDGDEIELDLPSHMEVCHDCEGHGYVLCEGMRNHAYSQEEFAESFDEEEAQEYFRRGGRYDVQCGTCHGKNVVAVVNEEALTPEQKAQYEAYLRYDYQRHQDEAEDRRTQRMEDGDYGY